MRSLRIAVSARVFQRACRRWVPTVSRSYFRCYSDEEISKTVGGRGKWGWTYLLGSVLWQKTSEKSRPQREFQTCCSEPSMRTMAKSSAWRLLAQLSNPSATTRSWSGRLSDLLNACILLRRDFRMPKPPKRLGGLAWGICLGRRPKIDIYFDKQM